ncbi:hypothetical protein HYFRA_00007731 [Hymenoscyphus fraxineus]|uniref:CFEM domain-containing protein n=1 Tax=Hymenoscyphus fraxineus TaxID=746836 RepID=A0A9N9KM46_9HELO|nr:hypothetical protein HYFRA_00007731 [Hymenoscyphus fraxineus]
MKVFASSFLLAIVAMVSAQDLPPDLPACAQACALPYFDSTFEKFAGCPARAVACVCTNTDFVAEISCCIYQNCTAAEQQTSVDFGNNLCSQVVLPGTPPLPSSASCPASSSPTPTPTPTPYPSSPPAVTVTVSPSACSAPTSTPVGYRIKGRVVRSE